MKILILCLTLMIATELEVDGNLKVTGSVDASGNPIKNVGAPVLDIQNRAIAAISLSGTKGTINIKTIPTLAEKVTMTSRKISLKISDFK